MQATTITSTPVFLTMPISGLMASPSSSSLLAASPMVTSSPISLAEGLVTAQQELGQTMGELGLMFMKLVKFENQEAVSESQRKRAVDMKNVATATIKASRLYRGLNDKTAYHLDVLHDYLGMMLAADHAFAE